MTRQTTAEVMRRHPLEEPRVLGVEKLFDPEDIHTVVTRGFPRSSPGPSGLGYRRLQVSISVPLVDSIVSFARIVFSGNHAVHGGTDCLSNMEQWR